MKHMFLEERGTYRDEHWDTLEPSVARLIEIMGATQHGTHAQRMRCEHLLIYGDPRIDPFCCKPNARILMQELRARGIEQNFVMPGKNAMSFVQFICFIGGWYINPRSQRWLLGGVGVWCPESVIDEIPQRVEESNTVPQQNVPSTEHNRTATAEEATSKTNQGYGTEIQTSAHQASHVELNDLWLLKHARINRRNTSEGKSDQTGPQIVFFFKL